MWTRDADTSAWSGVLLSCHRAGLQSLLASQCKSAVSMLLPNFMIQQYILRNMKGAWNSTRHATAAPVDVFSYYLLLSMLQKPLHQIVVEDCRACCDVA